MLSPFLIDQDHDIVEPFAWRMGPTRHEERRADSRLAVRRDRDITRDELAVRHSDKQCRLLRRVIAQPRRDDADR